MAPRYGGALTSLEERLARVARFHTVEELVAQGQFDGAIVCLPNNEAPAAITRYWLLGFVLVIAAATGSLAWEWVNPVSMFHRGLIFGFGLAWVMVIALVFLAWGIQAYVLRFANATMRSESIFFYMTLTGLLLVPVAAWMTDFGRPINWGPSGPWLAAPIQLLNSIGALTMVYAFRHGKVIIVSPMINALAPVITIVLSLLLYRVVPHRVVVAGMVLAAVAFYLMA